MTVRVLHTPGHTHTHLAYAVSHGGHPVAVFTGGSLLYGSTGRPDLLGPDHTDALVRAQWRSARRLADELPDDTAVYPTHGFGSFCSATQSDATTSTIGRERVVNPVLLRDERAFVEELLAGLDAHPAYYAHMAPANLAGPAAPDLSPPALADPAELRARIEAGEWVVDLRAGTAFAAGHVAGSLSFPLDGQFVTYLGWLIPWGTPVTLLGATADAVAEAQRELVRIGIDRPAAAAVGGPRDWAGGVPLATYRRASFDELAGARGRCRCSRRARRAAQRGTGGSLDPRLDPHPDPRAAGPARRGPGGSGVGALRGRLPRRRRRRVAPGPRPRGGRGGRRVRPGPRRGSRGGHLVPRACRMNRPARVDAVGLDEWMRSATPPRVIDVRTPAEFAAVHIPGSYNVPLDLLSEHRDELRRHLDTDVVLVCRSGQRAERAERTLAATGLSGVHVLAEGLSGWEGTGARSTAAVPAGTSSARCG